MPNNTLFTAQTLVNPLTLTDQSFINEPYPLLAAFRENAPIWWCEANKSWVVSRYNDTQHILRSPDFEKQIQRWKYTPNPAWLQWFPQFKALKETSATWMLNMNPPDHTRVRAVVGRAFAPSTIHALKPEIEKVAHHLLEQAKQREQFDLIADFAFPLPLAIIGLIIGIPVSDANKLKAWSKALVAIIGGNRALPKLYDSGKAVLELRNYLTPMIEERRKNPQNDLLSVLVQAEEDGTKLSTAELLSNLILLIVAGHETTVNLISNAVLCLLRHPEQLAMFKQKPELAHSVINEVLRYESPVQAAPRLANKDVVLSGQTIKSGDMVWMLLGSANRDEEQFACADVFDITRTSTHHLSFSEGIHRCIGASLAEAEGAIAITTLFATLPDLKLVSNNIEFQSPFALRGPRKLMVRTK
jgi:pimeloyl-[acyl-carrier protein] synthase